MFDENQTKKRELKTIATELNPSGYFEVKPVPTQRKRLRVLHQGVLPADGGVVQLLNPEAQNYERMRHFALLKLSLLQETNLNNTN
jgi:hypothetical protein